MLPEEGPYLQLELHLITRLDTGQAQLPSVDPQEHKMRLNRHHIYLLWGRTRGELQIVEKRRQRW